MSDATHDRSLVRKLAEVMATIERIPKRGHNSHFNYDYVMEADLVDAVRTELAKRHVILSCAVESVERADAGATRSGQPRTRTTLHMRFTLRDGDTGEAIESIFINEAIDDGDKGVNKAITAAKKYWILTNFLVPTGDDTERDEPPPKTAPPSKSPAAAQASAASTSPNAAGALSHPKGPTPPPAGSPTTASPTATAPSPATPPNATPNPTTPPGQPKSPPPATSPASNAPAAPPATKTSGEANACANCGTTIPESIARERRARYGRALCVRCARESKPQG